MITLSQRQVRRLALVGAGLLKPEWSKLPVRVRGRGASARKAAHRVVEHFGYLQLDSIPVAGARTHGIVLMSRLAGFSPQLAEELLQPGEPLFEYWGHEASWLPMELYPVFAFRRQALQVHPWWGDVLGKHPRVAQDLLARIRDEGPLRSKDFEGKAGSDEMWDMKLVKQVALALWSSGELSIRARRHFHRVFDLTERVVPDPWRRQPMAKDEALRVLLLRALTGHGWASTGTLAATWRLRKMGDEIRAAIAELRESGEIVEAMAEDATGRKLKGYIRPVDLERVDRLDRLRPRRDEGVLLSPFDPLLWDRARVLQFFGFEQVLEIYKPAAERVYGYYVLPVLAGDELVSRVDLKADRKAGTLRVVRRHDEGLPAARHAEREEAVRTALRRYAGDAGLEIADLD
jgi:uncharacterized protein YcaQ